MAGFPVESATFIPPEQVSGDEQDTAQPEAFELLDFHKAKVRIDALIGQWADIKNETKRRRGERKIKLDTEKMRQDGSIGEDELLIPVRIINDNITRELGDAMQFLNASQRLVYFRCVDDPNVDTRQLESNFTKGLTYRGWYKQFKKHYDGACFLGWDSIEVIYNEAKPLHVSFEHCGHDRLFYNRKIEDIQDAELILREFEVTGMRLETFVERHAFEKTQVDKLLKTIKDSNKDNQVIKIYKTYFKYQNCVYIAWYAKDSDVTSWLKAPEKLKCGILTQLPPPPQPTLGAALSDPNGMASTPMPMAPAPPQFAEQEVRMYPIFLYIYKDDEEAPITEHKGRGFLDLPQQEASTALTSAVVNGTSRASNVYVSVKPDVNGESNHKVEDLVLENSKILPVPLEFMQMDYPDPMILATLQMLDAANSKTTGKLATAVSNRKDSRKTAKELDVAEGEEQKISSISQADYSEWLREVFSFAWLIVQAQAMAGKISLLPPQKPSVEAPPTGVIENDLLIVGREYDLRPAGEVDVIEKQQTIQSIQQDWPVFQNTPIAPVLLEEYVRLRYPTMSDKMIAALRAGDMSKQLVRSLMTALQGAIQPEELQAVGPEGQAQLQQLMMSAKQYLSQGMGMANQQQSAPAAQ